MQAELEALFGRKVDLMERSGLERDLELPAAPAYPDPL